MSILIIVCFSNAPQRSRGIAMESGVPRKVTIPEEEYTRCQARKMARRVNICTSHANLTPTFDLPNPEWKECTRFRMLSFDLHTCILKLSYKHHTQ